MKNIWLIFIMMAASASLAETAPYLPLNDSQVLERLPAPGDAIKRELRRLRVELSQNPHNLDLATQLANRYIALGKSESDPRYNGYAQAALTPWWDLSEPPIEVLILRATLFQNRHEFDMALADLKKVLKADPGHAQAWLTQAVILEVKGSYKEALQSCLRLRNITSSLVRAACMSSVASRSGRADKSYKLLLEAYRRAPEADPSLQLWALTILAEIASSLDNVAAAEEHFRQARSLGIRDGYLLNAFADFLLDQGRPQEVLTMLADETRNDGALLRLSLAENRLKTPSWKKHVELLRTRFAENRLRGSGLHLREEARFTLHLLEKPYAALNLAQENWRLQREPWDARLVLEAALAAKTPEDAAPVLDWLNRSGVEDRKIKNLVEQFQLRSR